MNVTEYENLIYNHKSLILYLLPRLRDDIHEFYDAIVEYLKFATFTVIFFIIIYCALGFITYKLCCLSSGIKRRHQFHSFPNHNKKRVLFVTAHPYDECRFFGPTILNLKETCDLYLLCLTIGPHFCKEERKRELRNSCHVLGIPASNITIMNITRMPDELNNLWSPKRTSKVVLDHIITMEFNDVYTFDIGGVTGHKNHISIFYAFARMCLRNQVPSTCRVYLLDSVNKLRKYSMFLDAFLSISPLSKNLFLVSFGESEIIMEALFQYRSQVAQVKKEPMQWYHFIFCRYVFINTYRELDAEDVQLVLQMNNIIIPDYLRL